MENSVIPFPARAGSQLVEDDLGRIAHDTGVAHDPMSDETLLVAAVLGQLVATKRDLDRLHQLAVDGRIPESDGTKAIQATRETLAQDIDYLCDRLRPGPDKDQ